MALVLGEELHGGEERLDVLVLVLHDHVVHEPVAQEGLGAGRVEVGGGQPLQGPGADLVAVGHRLRGTEDGQRGPLRDGAA